MDENWDDEPQIASFEDNGGVNQMEGGKSFSKRGRGFSSNSRPLRSPNKGSRDRGEQRREDNDFKDSFFDDTNGDADNMRGRNDRGGRGGRGRGGGRGGNRFDGNRNNDRGNGFDNDENDDGRRGRYRSGSQEDGDRRSSSKGRSDNRRGKENFGGGRGRGGGRGGRGGGGRDGSRDRRDGSREGRREFGRGGGRGGGRDFGRDGRSQERNADSTSDQPPKPREIYIPPEPTNDEGEIFNTGISTGINFGKFDEINVEVTGDNIPPSISSFEDSGLRPLVLDNIKRSNYSKPTPIQKHAIPVIAAGRDLMGCAQTGSGKTAAFLLPIINDLLKNPTPLVVDMEHSEPQVLIVSPTRELTIQIYEEARKFSHDSGLSCVLAYGGTSVGYQRKHVANGCHILVATPGRLGDFARRGLITFSSIRYVVLDEADRMLDMGFSPIMEEVLGHPTMPPTGERKTLMFSATFPEEIQRLAAKFLHDYIFVTVGIIGSASTDVEQVVYQVDKFQKRGKLLDVLKESDSLDGTLIFVETKRNADFIASYLSENDFRTTSIHGDRLQREREEALRDFKVGKSHILVATSVAARGLDIKNVKHVINYDLPSSIDEYVHRIGRTGRVGNRGKASSFYDEGHDGALSGSLARILKQAGQNVPSWLFGGSSSIQTYDSSSAFGGCDMRGDVGQSKTVEVDEEQW